MHTRDVDQLPTLSVLLRCVISSDELERIREDIRRYQALLRVINDARAPEVLKEMIGELKARLGGAGPAPHDRT